MLCDPSPDEYVNTAATAGDQQEHCWACGECYPLHLNLIKSQARHTNDLLLGNKQDT